VILLPSALVIPRSHAIAGAQNQSTLPLSVCTGTRFCLRLFSLIPPGCITFCCNASVTSSSNGFGRTWLEETLELLPLGGVARAPLPRGGVARAPLPRGGVARAPLPRGTERCVDDGSLWVLVEEVPLTLQLLLIPIIEELELLGLVMHLDFNFFEDATPPVTFEVVTPWFTFTEVFPWIACDAPDCVVDPVKNRNFQQILNDTFPSTTLINPFYLSHRTSRIYMEYSKDLERIPFVY